MELSLQTIYYAVFLIAIFMLGFNLSAVIYRTKLYLGGLYYLICSNDNKGIKSDVEDPGAAGVLEVIQTAKIIFVRHGESTWNETFNRSKNPIFFIPRIIYSMAIDFWLLLSGKRDSWFYDSPLGEVGFDQAENLRKHLKTTKDLSDECKILKGDKGSSVIVSSNLRRALSTVLVGLGDRLDRGGNNEKVVVLPCLQEGGRNIDTLSITPPKQHFIPSWKDAEHESFDMQQAHEQHVDVSKNTTSKWVGDRLTQRHEAFNLFAFQKAAQSHVVIAGGHSLWFRSYFRNFLPHRSKHISKTYKIKNAGAIYLEVQKRTTKSGTISYQIVESTIQPLFLGFDLKGKKVKTGKKNN